MAKHLGDGSPTMIIPSGTRIQVDEHGQLSVRTPGNLVIQNSGTYGHLESVSGSIRIEQNVQVEAVSIQCGKACYVQGSLTAWKVTAQEIHLEDRAQAHIVLQETERLEVGKNARLVGNFGSEKELFLLFSRFARQVKTLPFSLERGRPAKELAATPEPPEDVVDGVALEGEELAADQLESAKELPDDLFFALIMLERDLGNSAYGPTSQRALQELIKLLRERDLEALRHTWRTLLSRVVEPEADVRRAEGLIQRHFALAERRQETR